MPTVTGSYGITITSTSSWIGLMLYNGCPLLGGGSCVGQVQSSAGTKTLTAMLTGGTTYYLIVDTWPSPTCIPLFDLSITGAYDPCASVPTLSCSTAVTATPSGTGVWNVTACGFSTPGRELVYSFTPTNTGTHALQVTAATGGYIDYFFKAASGGCSSTGWTCIDDINSPLTATIGTLTAGTQYFILLDPETTGTYSHTFQINCPVMVVDPCTSITTLACATSATATLSGTGAWNNATCLFSTPGQEKIYSFTPTTTGTHSLQVTSASGTGYFDYQYKAASGGCSATGWTCIDDINFTATVTIGTLTAGVEYYILIDAESSTSSTQTFQINCPSTVDPCTSITTLACATSANVTLVGTGAWNNATCLFSTPGQEKIYSFTPTVTGSHSLQVTSASGTGYIDYQYKAASGGCSPTGWTCIDDINFTTTVTIGTLTAGVEYYILLDAESTTSSLQTFHINCPALINPISIDNPSVAEGDAGTTDLTFTVSRTLNTVASSVDYAITGGTATSGDDYMPLAAGTINLPMGGALSAPITVQVNGDMTVEGDETVIITLSNPMGGQLGSNPGTGTIENDDAANIVFTSASTHPEEDAGTVNYTFTATLTGTVQDGFSVYYSTNDGTATAADNDYQDNDGVLTFAGTDGEMQSTIVLVNGDTKVELDEDFFVAIDSVVATFPEQIDSVDISGSPQSNTILNDDAAVITIANITLEEGCTPDSSVMIFGILMSFPSDTLVTVDYATIPGTATGDDDYSTVAGSHTFLPGETLKMVSVYIYGDCNIESDETYAVRLSSLESYGRDVTFSGGGATLDGTGTIADDDEAPMITCPEEDVVSCDELTCLTFEQTDINPLGQPISISYVDAPGVVINIRGHKKGGAQQIPVVLFDSDEPITEPDLGTPNVLYGGPGINESDPDEYNAGNNISLGFLLILQNPFAPYPDDHLIGDSMVFEFSQPVYVSGITAVDFEVVQVNSGAGVYLYDNAGEILGFFGLDPAIAGDNSIQELFLNTYGVSKLVMYYGSAVPSSGAVGNLCFTYLPSAAEFTGECGIASTSYTDEAIQTECGVDVMRTYYAEDICGNTASQTCLITIVGDYEQPEIICPADVILGCDDVLPDSDAEAVAVTDNCSDEGDIIVDFIEDITTGTGCEAVTRRIYRATDGCDHDAFCVQYITREEDTPQVQLTGRVFVEAAMLGVEMDARLNDMGYLPTCQPYGEEPFNYTGTEQCLSLPENIVDWVLVQLRDMTTLEVIAQRAGLVNENGDIVDLDGISPLTFDVQGDWYYIAVLHRNHMGILSDQPMDCTEGAVTCDFTEDHGLNEGLVEVSEGVYAMMCGDVNGDHLVKYNGSNNDKNAILEAVGISTPNNIIDGYNRFDVNMDGVVKYNGSSNDKNAILTAVGVSSPNNVLIGPLHE